ncbi:MAG: DegV family EDD domain-containing protein [Lachnospiraceae bacterium]|nr:DegV family EDD domain-containing protein [Lachnospiraceae bacterium]
MNPVRLIKKYIDFVKNPQKEFAERIFLLLAVTSEIAVGIALIGDIVTGDSYMECIVIGAEIIAVVVLTLVCLYYDKIRFAIRITVVALVFIIIPALFFFGGGLYGGGVIWIIFAYMYAGLVLKDRWRTMMFILITIVSLSCYVIGYYHPELVYPHSRSLFFVDSFISVVLVGILCYYMTRFQGRLFAEENERARKEAERAEELTRSQNRFFSSMSHEIRTPINSILGLNELILRDQEATDDIVKDASGIQGSGKMLLALINDILDFSKIEAGSMDIVPVDYHVGDMLSEIVNMLWLRAQDKGLGFEVEVDPEVPKVLYGDEVRIKQIIINLLNNAVKYTKEGHVGLRVESRDEDKDAVELVISISDTGMGIRKEDMPYLFDAFKRVDEGKNRHIEGTGLGLSIVRQLVELMDGTISVNSIYGEGSTFTVTVKQLVTDHTKIGELDIHNQQMVRRSAYESSFWAPEAKILIVDDNEMNLEVERRLLEDTDMGIDVALSGKEALEMCLTTHYDVIFMDHLMPGMDGIECREALREQYGGMNRSTPVIVLTANAGSENRELYNKAGFDGYLVKPVSGAAMEEVLIRHISREKVVLRSVMMGDDEEINVSDKYTDKLPVIVTSSSMCDLPRSVIKKLHIPIIPFVVKTDRGVFKDGVHMDANELIRHINEGKDAVSSPPDEAAYTEFFAEMLKKAHHLIHISITTSMSSEYKTACEAARSFDNVSIVNSECVSSATGILVLIAYKLVQQGLAPEEIVSELNSVKQRLKCSFVINTTSFMAKKGLVSQRLHRIADSLNIHPALTIKNDKAAIGGLWTGRTKSFYKRYISSALPPDTIPDSDVVFVTYVDIAPDMLEWIGEEIKKAAYFEHVIFKQASAAISSNCGPGTFGILYFLKSNKSYNIASFIHDVAADAEYDTEDEQSDMPDGDTTGKMPDDQPEDKTAEETPESSQPAEKNWYEKLSGIDGETAIKNSGSEEAFRTVLKIFFESIGEKKDVLEQCFSSEDWENYTIKIHALKSSARLVGALGLGEKAERLEMAGKEGDIGYIRDNHASVMEEYQGYRQILGEIYDEADSEDEDAGKPVADAFIMQSIYDEIRNAAESYDSNMIESIMKEAAEYAIPEEEKERFKLVSAKADILDYDGILEVLG